MAEKRVARFFFWCISLAYGGFLSALYFADYFPERYWWIANAVLIAPLWVILIPLVFLFYLAFRVKSIKGVYLHCLLILAFFFLLMDFRVVLKNQPILYGDTLTIRIMSVNAGEGMNGRSLYGYIVRMEPDIVIMQELRGDARMHLEERMREEGWEFMTKRGLALATRFPVVDTDIHEHYLLGARMDTPGGDLMVYDVHLETPRKGIEALMRKGVIGRWNMQGATDVQSYESASATALIPRMENIVVAGDFNLPQTNPLFKKYWSGYQNTFSQMGKGFGYSKYTRWHGVRIDHILTDPSWTVLQAQVGPDLGGDHRPMFAVIQKKIAEFILNHQKAFFVNEQNPLKPLILKDVAQAVERNESTICRAINNKYIQTPQGLYPVKYFFSQAVNDNATGENVASRSIKEDIKALIEDEDKTHPLSDKAIQEYFEKKGMTMARRTVSKYRQQMNILPSHLRKI